MIALRPAHTFRRRMLRALMSDLSAFKQRDLAAEMGTTEARISQILRGEANLTILTIERLLMAADRIKARDIPNEG